MTQLLLLYLAINIVATFYITIASLIEADSKPANVFIFPALFRFLRKANLNVAGIIIVIVVFSVFFLPAIMLYFGSVCVSVLAYLIGKGFICLFKKRC